MDNIMDFKSYEAEQTGMYLNTSMESLTTYYKCNKCNKTFNIFNEQATICSKCGSDNIKEISDFDYFTDLKNGDLDGYNKEFKKKRKREDTIIDLVELGEYNRMRQRKRNAN